MRITLPRTSPHRSILKIHHLVLVSNALGLEPWAGSIEKRRWGDSRMLLTVDDITRTLEGPKLEIVEDSGADAPAAGLYGKVIAAMNLQRALDGELEWQSDVQVTKQFRGDVDLQAEPFGLFRTIAERSGTEWAWTAKLVLAEGSSDLEVTLLARDQIVGPVGADLTDAPGSSNVQSTPVLNEDVTEMAHSLRLIGEPTRLEDELDQCFDWAVGTIRPEVLVETDPGEYRRQEPTEVLVQWGLGKSERLALAAQIRNQVEMLYETFLYAYHDQNGRPYHEGWRYDGPPSDIEQYLTTGLGWRTKAKLIEYQGKPAAAAMINRAIQQILIVLYDRVTQEKEVRRAWFSETGELTATQMRIHGYARRYDVEGGVIVGVHKTPFDHSGAIVSGPATFMWPGEKNTSHPTTTYHKLRRVISITEEGAVSEGQYHDDAKPVGPTTTAGVFTRPTIGDAPYKTFMPLTPTTGVASSAITKVADFERRRICDWDPRRDGIGAFLNRRTVVDNAPSTKARWHFVEWGANGAGITQLAAGCTATDTELRVDSLLVLPNTYPYTALLDDGLSVERVRVYSRGAGYLRVNRGVEGTTAIEHEPGSRFELVDRPEWNGLELDYDWSSGLDYATGLLARLNHPARRMTVKVTNRDGTWGTVTWGSIHTSDIVTEGDTQIDGDWRVLGWAPSGDEGVMELLVEEYLP